MSDLFELFRKIAAKPESAGAPTAIVCGLGNPGPEYVFTRHNAGFLAMDYFSQKLGAELKTAKFKALTTITTIGGERVLLMKPQTYMNLSGEAVRQAAEYYRIPPENIIVVSDEVSLPVGKIRIRAKGSAGGHNGLKNIIYLSGIDNRSSYLNYSIYLSVFKELSVVVVIMLRVFKLFFRIFRILQ